MMILRVMCAVLIFGLAGCASYAPAPVVDGRSAGARSAAPAEKLYTVRKGDTLKSIAQAHGVDYRDLAAWNNIENINLIRLGQQLRVAAPAVAPVAAAEGTEVRPIAEGGSVVARSLEGGSDSAAVSPAPTLASAAPANTETFKRAPKGGKLPYSEENLARLKAEEAGPVALAPAPAVPTVTAAAAPAPAAAAPPEIEWAWPAPGELIGRFSEAAAGGQEVLKGIDIAGKIGDPVHAAAAGKVIYVGVFPKHGNLVVLLHGGGYSSVYAHNSRMLVKEGQMVTRGQKIAEFGDSDADRPKLHFELRQQGKPVDPLKFLPTR